MAHTYTRQIAEMALKAMFYEVAATPKPGLVDRDNNGSHKDMDFYTFIDSSISLLPVMETCARKGFDTCLLNPEAVLPSIRETGIEGEKRMLSATQGVNTHKGALFSLGILCAAAGRILGQDGSITTATLSETSARISAGILERELMPLLEDKGCKTGTKRLSAGEILFIRHGFCGIRGEVASGFKTVIEKGLPDLEHKLRKGVNLNDALVDTFLSILTVSEDSNIVWRSGLEGLDYCRRYARKVLDSGGVSNTRGKLLLNQMDIDFTQKRISPGGTADLLAVTVMFHLLDSNSWKGNLASAPKNEVGSITSAEL